MFRKYPKGQLISKCPFGVIIWTKYQRKNLTISALESSGEINKIKALSHNTIIYI